MADQSQTLREQIEQLPKYYPNGGLVQIDKTAGPMTLIRLDELRVLLENVRIAQASSSPSTPDVREKLSEILTVVIQSWDRCTVCGMLNDDEHDQMPHVYEGCDYTALFLEELRLAGLSLSGEAKG